MSPELVRDGVDGWLVQAGDVEALADAMAVCLAATREQLEAIGRSAHARVDERRSIDLEAARLRSMFDAAIVERAS